LVSTALFDKCIARPPIHSSSKHCAHQTNQPTGARRGTHRTLSPPRWRLPTSSAERVPYIQYYYHHRRAIVNLHNCSATESRAEHQTVEATKEAILDS
jgi:hypothetical protein